MSELPHERRELSPPSLLGTFWRSFSGPGLLVGAAFLAASLTPSLIPRSFALQGALAGTCFAVGYGLAVLATALWIYLGLPVARGGVRRTAAWGAAAVAAALVLGFMWRASAWQNSIRVRMDMPPVDSARPLEVGLISFVVFTILVLVARLFSRLRRAAQRRSGRYVPVRVSRVIGIAAALVVFALVFDGLLMRGLIRSADYSFQNSRRAYRARHRPAARH